MIKLIMLSVLVFGLGAHAQPKGTSDFGNGLLSAQLVSHEAVVNVLQQRVQELKELEAKITANSRAFGKLGRFAFAEKNALRHSNCESIASNLTSLGLRYQDAGVDFPPEQQRTTDPVSLSPTETIQYERASDNIGASIRQANSRCAYFEESLADITSARKSMQLIYSLLKKNM